VLLEERFGVSERRACTVIGQPRSTHRLDPPVPLDDEMALRRYLRDFAIRRPRWGWRRALVAAREDGWRVNAKRVHRLWRDEGLRVSYKKRKTRLKGIGVVTGAFCPIRPNVVWAADFQFDQTRDGRTIKILNVIDEFTREALVAETDRSIDADHVVRVLDKIAGERGFPKYLRFDNGPEFVAFAVADWCRFNEAETIFIDPGSPWQNAWVESYNGRMRDEHLNGQLFDTLFEAQVLNEAWRVDYNENRPHSAHGWKSPAAFAAAWITTNQPSLA
jgi:putative transposase